MRFSRRRPGAALALSCFFATLGASAGEEGASPAVVAARKAIEEQRYDDARTLVRDDLASPVAARRAPALELTAVALLLEAKNAEAEPYVHALFELAPAFRLEDASLPPRVTDPFRVEATKPHARAIALAVRADVETGAEILEASQPPAHVALQCRPRADAAFGPVSLASGGTRSFRFKPPTSGVSSCFALATDADDLPLGRLGSQESPFEIRPLLPPTPSKGLLGRWWFWTAVGAVVVGGATLVYVETRPREVAPPPADLTVAARSFRFP